MTVRFVLLLLVASSCTPRPPPPQSESASAPLPVVTAQASASAPVPELSAPVASSDPSLIPAPPAPEPPLAGEDFVAQARTLFRVAACGPVGDVPSRFDAAVVTAHCDELRHAYDDYTRGWVDIAQPFIAALRPSSLPRVAVYPFGGGDLAGALATFPDAAEITTISLEPAGDVRAIDTMPADRLGRELWAHRSHLERLFEKAHSRTDNLDKESKADLPGEIVFDLAALVVHKLEPVGLRYFRLRPDGSLLYVTAGDIEGTKSSTELRALFTNVELRFRKLGEPNATVQVLRHISYNLDDAHLGADPALLAHLSAKGKVAAMTKAASHLLWSDHFSIIRGWLAAHTDWMISDSTGIPPRVAVPAGFAEDAYGTFSGPAQFGLIDARDAADVKRLFDTQPRRELPFRYGYPDQAGRAHLIVTRRGGEAPESASSTPKGPVQASDAGAVRD